RRQEYLPDQCAPFGQLSRRHPQMVLGGVVIPLIIISFAFVEAFNPHRDVGNVLVSNLHLTGSTAQIVRGTFTNASSGKSVALSISLISLLITGLDVRATAPIANARAVRVAPFSGARAHLGS